MPGIYRCCPFNAAQSEDFPEYIAKKLYPDLIVLPCNFSRYSEMSKAVMNIFRRYDPNMLAASVDEGYLKYGDSHTSMMWFPNNLA